MRDGLNFGQNEAAHAASCFAMGSHANYTDLWYNPQESGWGANVVHKGNALVHVSGHASAGELLYCYNVVRPSNVLPVHGEFRHMKANAELAREAP